MIYELVSRVKRFDEDLADDLLDAIDDLKRESYNDGWGDRENWGSNDE